MTKRFKNIIQNHKSIASNNEEKKLREAFQSANAIVDLADLPFNDEMAVRQERIIRGELTFDEAVEQIISTLKAKQG